MENVKLKVELSQQNTKFEKMFESLEQEGISIKNTVSKQKVGIKDLISKYEKHDEVLEKIQVAPQKNIKMMEISIPGGAGA